MAALLAGALAGLPGCTPVLQFEPASPAQVRAALSEPPHEPDTQVHLYTRDAKPFGDRYQPGEVAPARFDMFLDDLRKHCAEPGKCPVDDPTARWELGTYHDVVDGGKILGVSLVGGIVVGLPAANIVCFSGNNCSDGVKTGVIVTDVAVGSLLVLTLVLFAGAFTHFRGD
jgi:hypothetical protein